MGTTLAFRALLVAATICVVSPSAAGVPTGLGNTSVGRYAAKCTADGDRCGGEDYKAYVEHPSCCSSDHECVPVPNVGWGLWCVKREAYVDDKKCYKPGERCADTPWSPYWTWRPCCDGSACEENPSYGPGAFCAGPRSQPGDYDTDDVEQEGAEESAEDGDAYESYHGGEKDDGVEKEKPMARGDCDEDETDSKGYHTRMPSTTKHMRRTKEPSTTASLVSETTTQRPEPPTRVSPTITTEATTRTSRRTRTREPSTTKNEKTTSPPTRTRQPATTTSSTNERTTRPSRSSREPSTTTKVTTTPQTTTTTGSTAAAQTRSTTTESTMVPQTTSTTTESTPSSTSAVVDNCNRVRKSVDDYTTTEWGQYVAAVEALRSSGEWDDFIQTHSENEFQWHQGSYFLPSHRQYLWEFETALRRHCATCTVPYWDWSLNPGRWTFDAVWKLVGGADGGTIPSAPFNDFEVQVPNKHVPVRECVAGSLTNANGEQIGRFESRTSLDLLVSGEILGAVGFADFADYLEIIHGAPHNEIGGRDGDMSDGRYSPADPIFYLHHATIDRIWAEWQAAGNGNEFNGVHRVLPRNAAQQAVAPVSVDEVLGPARWGRTVQETLEGEPSICVSYTGVGGGPGARMAMQTKVRQAGADGAGYSTKEVKERVETEAAKKKASDGKAYKEACAEIIESRKTFYAGAEFAGFKKEFIDAAYSKKKFLDTAANGVLLEDVEDPEAVVTKPTKDVESEGRVKYEAVNTQSAGVVDTASSPPLTKPTAAPTAWYGQAGDEYYGA